MCIYILHLSHCVGGQESQKLSSQLAAQGSVLEGLREERQLWSRELAQQGAELAQDRGRMEAQIEALKQESGTLREQLQVSVQRDTVMYILYIICVYV